MFKCLGCGNLCEDIDTPNCTDTCSRFSPQKILARHLITKGNILCTGRPPKPGTIALGRPDGVNCIRCRVILKKQYDEKATAAKEKAEEHYQNLIKETPEEELDTLEPDLPT